MVNSLPSIPAKRYFTIGEVGDLCGVKPHVLRYWEQEFTQLRPIKRRGNRRYYQHHEVLMIRRIRDLLYDQGFTISGARNRMQEILQSERGQKHNGEPPLDRAMTVDPSDSVALEFPNLEFFELMAADSDPWQQVRQELVAIRDLLVAVD